MRAAHRVPCLPRRTRSLIPEDRTAVTVAVGAGRAVPLRKPRRRVPGIRRVTRSALRRAAMPRARAMLPREIGRTGRTAPRRRAAGRDRAPRDGKDARRARRARRATGRTAIRVPVRIPRGCTTPRMTTPATETVARGAPRPRSLQVASTCTTRRTARRTQAGRMAQRADMHRMVRREAARPSRTWENPVAARRGTMREMQAADLRTLRARASEPRSARYTKGQGLRTWSSARREDMTYTWKTRVCSSTSTI